MRLNGSHPGEFNYLIPISNGLLTPEHRKRMGVAVWEFAWLVDRTASERDGFGIVLGGKPITYSEIARQLGLSDRTVQENCHTLKDKGYIHMERTPYGIKFLVAKSKKFAASRTEETFRSDGRRSEESFRSDKKEPSDQTGRNLPLQKDNTVDNTDDKFLPSPSASDEKKSRLGKKAPSNGGLNQREFSDVAYRLFAEKYHGEKPTWRTKDFVQLPDLLEIRPNVTVDEFSQRYKNFLGSPDPFHHKKGGSLAFFCSNYDEFMEPIPAANSFRGGYVNRARQRELDNTRAAQGALQRATERDRQATDRPS